MINKHKGIYHKYTTTILKWYLPVYISDPLDKEVCPARVPVIYEWMMASFRTHSPFPLEVWALQESRSNFRLSGFHVWDQGYTSNFQFIVNFLNFYLKITLTCWDLNLHQFFNWRLWPLGQLNPIYMIFSYVRWVYCANKASFLKITIWWTKVARKHASSAQIRTNMKAVWIVSKKYMQFHFTECLK